MAKALAQDSAPSRKRPQLLKRRIQVAADDSRPGISMEEMKALLREKREAPLPEPARWEKRSRR